MSAHTPGPWFTSRPHGTIYIEARLRGSTLQEVAAVGPTEAPEQQMANAVLIAEAPELLRTLRNLHARASRELPDPEDIPELHDALDAITRAEGRNV
ncbi:MAG: hypothetical protein I8H71_01410 [Xanthomonadaceae bacterium]|nr:hypothetical protein [Xanthomonadaceae bacterium]